MERRREKSTTKLSIFANGFQFNIVGAVFKHLSSSFGRTLYYSSSILPEYPTRVRILTSRKNGAVMERWKNSYFPQPISHLIDLFFVLFAFRSTVAISFSPHMTAILILLKRMNLVKDVVHWNVDFSPKRFENFFLRKLYDSLDRIALLNSDYHFDITDEALLARLNHHKLTRSSLKESQLIVVPVGIPDEDILPISTRNFQNKRVFFLGNLTEFVGIDTFIMAARIMHSLDSELTFHVIGGGPLLVASKKQAVDFGLNESITFYGNLEKEEFEPLLQSASVAIAPYKANVHSFSWYGDPGKIKIYMQFAIPMVVTRVPPIAKMLQRRECASVCADDLLEIVNCGMSLTQNEELWLNMRKHLANLSLEFKWSNILSNVESTLKIQND